MSDLLGGSSDGISAKYTTDPSLPNEPGVALASFRFKKIGQPPALLQRMLASGGGTQHVSPDSRSPSPDLEDELLISDSDAINNGLPLTNAQPSLRARIAMSEPPIPETENMDVDTPIQIQNHDSSAVGLGLTQLPHKPSAPKDSLPSTFPPSNINTTSSKSTNEHRLRSAEMTPSGPSPFSGPSSVRRVPSAKQTAIHHANPSEAFTFSESSTLQSLRDIQSLLSADLNSFSTDFSDAIKLGQTIKDQCSTVLSASRNAHGLARQSIASARESLEASIKGLAVAESLQSRVDELMASVTRINSERNEEWRKAIAPFTTRLTQLIEEVKDQERSNAEARLQTERKQRETESEVNTEGPAENTNTPMNNSTSVTDQERSRIEREATIATELLIRARDEARARQQAAEEVLRQRREAEDLLEQQRQRAQAELELLEERFKQVQTARLEAERKERLRQEEEIRIMRQKEEEKKLKEEQAAQLAIEERNKRAALELQKEQVLQQKKLERETALRERLEKEKLIREQDAKALQRKDDEMNRLRLQELKRQEINDQKVRANQEAAQKIQANRARRVPPQERSGNQDSQAGPTAFGNAFVSNNALPSKPPGSDPTSTIEAKSLPLTVTSPSQKAASVSGAIRVQALHSSSKTRPSMGLPSPPLEEKKSLEGQANDHGQSFADPALEVERSHEAAAGLQTHQRTTQPESQSGHTRHSEAGDLDMKCVETGTGKFSSSFRPQTTPISPAARKANSRKSTIKPDPEENKLIHPGTVSLGMKDDHKPIVKTETPDKKLKLKFDSPSDHHIPPLSMPSPPPHPTLNETPAVLPMPDRENHPQRLLSNKRHVLDPVDNTSSAPRANLPLPGRCYNEIVPKTAPTMDTPAPNISAIVPSHSHSLPAKPPPVKPSFQAHPSHITNNDALVHDFNDNRMGPDADDKILPFHPRPMEADDTSGQQRKRLASRVDHYSPSPPPPLNYNSRVLARPHRGDHYSPPRRSPELRRTSPGPSWYRQRDPDEGSNARGASPGPPAQHRSHRNVRYSPSPEGDAQIGRKRSREIQDGVGPPSNRPRHLYTGNTDSHTRGNPNAVDSRPSYEDDWSRTANYARSPSPEPRLTPLAFRLEAAPDPVRPPAPAPRYTNNYSSDQHRRRDTGLPYTRTASFSSEIHSNPPNIDQRQNTGDRPDGSRPHLLDRFTDLPTPTGGPVIPSGPSHQYYNKGPRPRKQPYQRPNDTRHQQGLEQRVNSKTSLISRIQQQS